MAQPDEQLKAEIEFLQRLARTEPLAAERTAMDGAALIIRDEPLAIEVVIEVRLPGTVEAFTGAAESDHGRLLIFLQNCGDQPLRIAGPDFLWTSGLALPWHVGVQLFTNVFRAEYGEVLTWQVHFAGAPDNLGVLAADVAEIARKCRGVAVRSRVSST